MTSNAASSLPPPSLDIETLRERILTGGSGAANPRGTLTKVAGRFAEFARSLSDDGGGASSSSAAEALRTELSLHELEVRKLVMSARASDRNSARYDAALSRTEGSLASVQADIEALTGALARERRTKRNREEYDALARMGNDAHPPVRETRAELERVEAEIQAVRGDVRRARNELLVREKQMRAFLQCLGDLRASLGEEELRKEVAGEGGAAAGDGGGKKRKRQEGVL